MYRKILVPLDGSLLAEQAVYPAIEIASATGAEVIFMRAVQDSLASVPEARIGADSDVVYAAAARGLDYLRRVKTCLRWSGVRARFEVLEGDPIPTILCFARRENVDAIVMGTHARRGIAKLLRGSVAMKVAVTTRRPVVLVKPSGWRSAPRGRGPAVPPDREAARHAA